MSNDEKIMQAVKILIGIIGIILFYGFMSKIIYLLTIISSKS